jgi:nitrous oxidase accessory protein
MSLAVTSSVCLGLLIPFTVGVAQDLVVQEGTSVPTLGAAMLIARSGNHIVVRKGVYREPTIVIDVPGITIEGDSGAVLDGRDAKDVLLVTADSVTIRGLTIRHVATSYIDDRAAIKFQEVAGCVAEHNRIEDAFFGIYLAKSTDCTIRHNVALGRKTTETKSGNAIHLWNSRDVLVEDNVVSGHRDGIYFEFVTGAMVRRNVSTNNLRYGLHFMFSHQCEYWDNEFISNGAGVAVMYTKRVVMVGNKFEDNWGSAAFGLLLKDITDSRVEDNVFRSNSTAIHAEGSNRLTVRGNEFVANGWAVKIMANSIDNEFTGNRFSGNAFDVSTNSRSSFSRFSKNYWDAYQGYDLDRDGYGDVPFRPVRLFALLVEQYPPSIILMRSAFVDMLDLAERIMPILTPEALVDEHPLMEWRQ